MIFLLDLNFTLVSNNDQKKSPFIRQIQAEEYRMDLVERMRGQSVILITARPAKYKGETLESIARKCDGWQPEEAYFNDLGLPPPVIKESILNRFVLPKHGAGPYFGIESNPKTRAMYSRFGIDSVKYSDFMQMNNGR